MTAEIVAFVVWVVANLAYYDFRRDGVRGARRFFAFWFGWPTTFVTLLVVSEGDRERLRSDDEGLDELVREIRRDRALREGDRRPSLGEGGSEPDRNGSGSPDSAPA